MTKAVQATGEVTAVTSPYDFGTISRDGRSALVQLRVRGDPETANPANRTRAEGRRRRPGEHEELRIGQIGSASMGKTFEDAFGDDFQQAEFSAVPVALGILLIAFGALVAALLPVALALTAIVATMGLTMPVSHPQPMSDAANSVMLLGVRP